MRPTAGRSWCGKVVPDVPEELASCSRTTSVAVPLAEGARERGHAASPAAPPPAEREGRIETSLAEVGLADATDQFPWQLSGGMQQRVAIARAIAYKPQLLLMDEPFGSVDAQTRADLQDLVLDVWRRTR